MPAMMSRVDPALFGKLKSGDERALEQLFRDRYDALIRETTPLLHGDGAAAAKGVEKVFEQVWKDHDDFETPDALESFLHNAVHEAAARINSRHAIAHQLAEHEGVHAPTAVSKPAPKADEAWGKVYAALHVSEARASAVAHQMAARSRHEAAGQLAELGKPRALWPMVTMGLVLAVGAGAFALLANRGREAAALTTGLAAADTRTASTGAGEFNNVSLSDGSAVQLGPDSKLRIPRTYGNAIRGVELQGTAVFTVAGGQTTKFLVRAGNATIMATGTEFVVRGYPDEHAVAVRVREGTLRITVGDSVHTLAAGASMIIAKGGATHAPNAAELEEHVGWVDGSIVANDRTIKEMIVLARRWFGVQLFVPDSTLLDRKVSVRAKVGAGEEAIAAIEQSGGVKREWEGTNMVLRDKNAKGTKAR